VWHDSGYDDRFERHLLQVRSQVNLSIPRSHQRIVKRAGKWLVRAYRKVEIGNGVRLGVRSPSSFTVGNLNISVFCMLSYESLTQLAFRTPRGYEISITTCLCISVSRWV
jgi:hypothetical protein